jgi:transposase
MIVKNYFKLNAEIKEIYDLVQEFRRILLDYHGFKRSFISDKLKEWTNKAMKCFKKFIKTLETWWDEVLNACIFNENNGKQEGFNNEIKLVKRRGFGYTNYSNFKYRIFAQCNDNEISQNCV